MRFLADPLVLQLFGKLTLFGFGVVLLTVALFTTRDTDAKQRFLLTVAGALIVTGAALGNLS